MKWLITLLTVALTTTGCILETPDPCDSSPISCDSTPGHQRSRYQRLLQCSSISRGLSPSASVGVVPPEPRPTSFITTRALPVGTRIRLNPQCTTQLYRAGCKQDLLLLGGGLQQNRAQLNESRSQSTTIPRHSISAVASWFQHDHLAEHQRSHWRLHPLLQHQHSGDDQ